MREVFYFFTFAFGVFCLVMLCCAMGDCVLVLGVVSVPFDGVAEVVCVINHQ